MLFIPKESMNTGYFACAITVLLSSLYITAEYVVFAISLLYIYIFVFIMINCVKVDRYFQMSELSR